MKNLIIILFLAVIQYGCTSNNNSINIPSIDGATFVQTSYVLETAFDINGDGLFSNDIYEEITCGTDAMRFNFGETVWNPTHSIVSLRVTDDGNGNLSQTAFCGHLDGSLPTYSQVENQITIEYTGSASFAGVVVTGILSDDGDTLTFNFSNDLLWAFNFNIPENQILNQNGSITEYESGAIVTYTRQ